MDFQGNTTFNGQTPCFIGQYCQWPNSMYNDSTNGGGFHANNFTGTPGVSGGAVNFGQSSAESNFYGNNLFFRNQLILVGGTWQGIRYDAANTGIWSPGSGLVQIGTASTGDDSGTLDDAQYISYHYPTAPTGSCPTNGAWVFSQDGHATFCAAGTWVTKL